MAMTVPYKKYAREGRVMTVEELFNKGIFFTDTPLEEGYVKTLVNYNITRDGSTLTPRGGLYSAEHYANILSAMVAATPTWGTALKPCIHHTGMTLVKDVSADDAILCRYALVGMVELNTAIGKVMDLAHAVLLVELSDGLLHVATNNNTNAATIMGSQVTQAHGSPVVYDSAREGIFTSIEGCTYMQMVQKSGELYTRKFGVITPVLTGTTLTWTIAAVVPKEIQPTQAINYGYNMLKEDPYAFANSQTATGALILSGVVPKDKLSNVIFTSRVGEEVNFHLSYQYPVGDVGKQYYVQWEVNDLETSSASTVIRSLLSSPTAYTAGDAIVLTMAPSYKSFTLIAKVYYKTAIDAFITATPAATQADIDNLSPLKSLILASYYLTADNNSSTYNVTPKKFDLTTATGMCTWQQRLVLWGVKGARTTLFVSEPNTPAYIPYPNNSEILSENIVAAVPYMGKLLVFTYNSLYLLTMGLDGISYTTKCIQDNLIMSDDDSCTIRTVKNMVYFRSGNYFHMVVPNSYAGVGELQLAPISNPVAPLLDKFAENMAVIVDNVYNLVDTFGLIAANEDTYTLTLTDYNNYLDGDKMRNVYKWRVRVHKSGVDTDFYLDTILAYDTVLRVWTTYMHQSTANRLRPYEYNVADFTTFLNLVNTNGIVSGIDVVKTSVLLAEDTWTLDTATTTKLFPNYQMIDTGYRKHSSQIKKRFREIQFTVNNTSHALLNFYTSVFVDDDTRKNMYTYETIHVTDKLDPNYGLVFVERTMCPPEILYGDTLLGDSINAWQLDFSKFPDLTIAKVAFKITGKGYNGKLRLLSKNNAMYELLTTNWVYRTMYAR